MCVELAELSVNCHLGPVKQRLQATANVTVGLQYYANRFIRRICSANPLT
jgi:hypothetical protein